LSRQKANRSQFRRIRKGLIWHFQGSGKSLFMAFAAPKLRLHPKLGNPTVIIVVDRMTPTRRSPTTSPAT
jgi:type I restriction enzyme R subunit